MKTDPRVDTYIQQAAPFAQPILTHLRKFVHRADPDAEEAIKWLATGKKRNWKYENC